MLWSHFWLLLISFCAVGISLFFPEIEVITAQINDVTTLSCLREMEDLPLWGAPSLRQKLACFIVYMLIINQIVRKNNVQRNNKENITFLYTSFIC